MIERLTELLINQASIVTVPAHRILSHFGIRSILVKTIILTIVNKPEVFEDLVEPTTYDENGFQLKPTAQ